MSTMRRLCLVVACVVSLVAILAATDRDAAAAELNIGLSGIPSDTLDPIVVGISQKFYLAQVFDYLVGTDATGKLSKDAGLARDWTVNDERTRWTFFLRDGVKFQNGDPVTSDDVKFSLVRAMGPRSATGYAGLLKDTIAAIDTPSADQVVITTKRPSWYLLDAVSRAVSSEGMIVPKNYIEAKGDDYFNLNPIGSGPYRVAEHQAGSYVRLEAMPSHWRTGVPRYKTITIRSVPEETTRIAMLRQGKLDIIDIGPMNVDDLRGAGFQIHLKEGDSLINCWWLEPWADTPMGDRRVREALNIAINRQELGDTLFSGMAKPAYIPLGFSWSFPDMGLTVTPDLKYDFDPGRAKQLIADAGHPAGFPIAIYAAALPGLTDARDLAEAIAGYWGNAGVQVKVVPLDYAALRKVYTDRSAPGAVMCYNQANRNAYGAYSALTKFGYFDRPTGFMHDPEIANLITAIGGEIDADKRNALMRTMFVRLRRESLDIPLLDVDTPYAAAKTLPAWDPGSVMFDLNLDQLITAR